MSGTGGNYVGGLLGYANGTASKVSECYAEVEVSGASYVGGLLGYGCGTVTDSYAEGTVTSTSSDSYAGGLVGYGTSLTVKNCYAACKVSTNGKGLVYVYSSTTVTNSYYDAQVTGWSTQDNYNKGKLTTAFLREKTFINWDFETVWKIEEGKSRPYLREGEEKEVELIQVKGGAGTEASPYEIRTAEDLAGIRYEQSGSYCLMEDIDFKGEKPGTAIVAITGKLDGKGHVLKNFKVTGSTNTGLFYAVSGAVIKNLVIEEAEVTGTADYAGILAGNLDGGTVANVSVKGCRVTGKNYVGGLLGYVKVAASKVSECYAEVEVSGASYVGGLLGYGCGTVTDSYAEGTVTSTSSDSYTGGLVGYGTSLTVKNCYAACKVSTNGKGLVYALSSTTVTNSYYDAQVTGWSTQDNYNKGKLTTAFLREKTFINWDFETVWKIEEGKSRPYLREGEEKEVELIQVKGGAGTEASPYEIRTAEDLAGIRYEQSGSYCLVEDIDFEGEKPGTTGVTFKGQLDGTGHVLKNFKVTGSTNTGLFYAVSGAVIKNLVIEEAEVTGTADYAGILAGNLDGGTVANVSVKGCRVTGKNYVGGLLGYVKVAASKVSECYAEVEVSGASYVGGLLGYGCGTVTDSYAEGTVTSTSSDNYTGGLVGYGWYLKVKNSYAACKVSASGKGLVYALSSSTVTNSYYDAQVTGWSTQDNYNKGKLTTAFLREKTFINWDFETVWKIEEGKSRPYLREGEEKEVELIQVKGGAGTETSPYEIRTAEDMAGIRYEPSGSYCLVEDIDFEGEKPGTTGVTFKGQLDGTGHVLKNFKVTGSTNTGLFYAVSGAVIKNLVIEEAEVTGTANYTGALTGNLSGGTLAGVSVKGCRVTGTSYVGGLSGYADGSTIQNCQVKGSVSGTGGSYVGGLLGYVNGTVSKVLECYAEVEVSGASYLGGLIGQAYGTVIDSYAEGKVISTTSSSYAGGLVGYGASLTVKNCYAACKVNANGKGLVYALSSTTVTNSFFDSDLSGITTPEAQAKTTEQMFNKDTYKGWDMEKIWFYEENTYPVLRKIQYINQDPFELFAYKVTGTSVHIKWMDIPNVEKYEVSYLGRTEKVSEPEILIEGLAPDTVYTFKVTARIDSMFCIYSRTLNIKTRRLSGISGFHCIEKCNDSITLIWEPIEGAESYEITYNGDRIVTNESGCVISELLKNTTYVISIKALYDDGSSIEGESIVEKIYELIPQTDYAQEFINKCEGQMWFIDEVENLLNQRGKSINTINAQSDFSTIYALCIMDRGVCGWIPSAIGLLSQLRYLYLADNNLEGTLPVELDELTFLIEKDLSGNCFEE